MINEIKKWVEKELSIEKQIYYKLKHIKNKLTIQYNKTKIAYIIISNTNIVYVDLIFEEVIEYKNNLLISSIELLLKKLEEIKVDECQIFDEYNFFYKKEIKK